YFYQKRFDRESLQFARFVVHLRYFAQRLFQGQLEEDTQEVKDIEFRQFIIHSCRNHYKCAQRIADYVRNAYHKELSEEELIYLAIHLKRINLE
ncbi:MAG: PRD domain-containing protein, partial [Butyricicoccus sp.]|nr:PRD domain-containing protein [Butyricicoccus sp.]